MRPTLVSVLVPFALCAAPLGAQTAAGSSAQFSSATAQATVLSAPVQGTCPVAFAADHVLNGAIREVRPAEKRVRPQPAPLALRLNFGPLSATPGGSALAIASAQIVLHGLAGGTLLPAQGAARAKPDGTSEWLSTEPTAAGKQRFESIVYTRRLTGVQWVELQSLTYANGSTWTANPQSPCRIVPKGFMLVAGR